MVRIKCLIADDEPLAQKGLAEYIADVDFLELIGVCNSAAQAYPFVNSGQADLLFLDIEMPGLSGIDFVKSLSYLPAVIFTTAYPEYAVQGYELDVIDYLVKPFSFPRFLKAVNKAKDFLTDKGNEGFAGERNYFFIKANYKVEKILYSDILFVEALQNYVAIHLADRKLVSYMTISNMEKQLPSALFMRIHKSYIVSIASIEIIDGNKVIVGAHQLPVSRTAKDKLMQAVNHKLIKR